MTDYWIRRNERKAKLLLFCLIIGWFQLGNRSAAKKYDETLEVGYFFEDTVMQILGRSLFGIIVGILVLLVVLYFCYRKVKKKTMGKILAAYFVVVLVVLSGLSVPMNKSYEIGGSAMKNAQVIFACARDMIEEEYVTFQDEPCEYRYEESNDLFGSRDTFCYLCLNNRKDVIPIPYEYFSEIREILEESGGVCHITCYKNSHLIRAINGVELTALR